MPIPPGPANASPPIFNRMRLYFGTFVYVLMLSSFQALTTKKGICMPFLVLVGLLSADFVPDKPAHDDIFTNAGDGILYQVCYFHLIVFDEGLFQKDHVLVILVQ